MTYWRRSDHRALEFGEAPQHLHQHAAGGRRSDLRLGEAPEAGCAAHSPLPRAGFAHGAINRSITLRFCFTLLLCKTHQPLSLTASWYTRMS